MLPYSVHPETQATDILSNPPTRFLSAIQTVTCIHGGDKTNVCTPPFPTSLPTHLNHTVAVATAFAFSPQYLFTLFDLQELFIAESPESADPTVPLHALQIDLVCQRSEPKTVTFVCGVIKRSIENAVSRFSKTPISCLCREARGMRRHVCT